MDVLFDIKKAGGYPRNILKYASFDIKKAGGYPPSILKDAFFGIKRLVDTHQAF
jgi:hypothetical protein